MKIISSTGYRENYWGDWFTATQIGGSENIVIQTAVAWARGGHDVTVRLPYDTAPFVNRGVKWVGQEAANLHGDLLFCFDDHQRCDSADVEALVVCRSDPPQTTDFHQMIFLSQHHARLMGHPGRPFVGGGVWLSDYAEGGRRKPGMVICTSSPDRCLSAFQIGSYFPNFVFTYKPIMGLAPTRQVNRGELVELQKQAQCLIYPLDPSRPSDFFSMAVLEAMAAGTPVVVSDADSMPELWSESAIVLPRPIRVSEWVEKVEEVISSKTLWGKYSSLGKQTATRYDWSDVSKRYIEAAMS